MVSSGSLPVRHHLPQWGHRRYASWPTITCWPSSTSHPGIGSPTTLAFPHVGLLLLTPPRVARRTAASDQPSFDENSYIHPTYFRVVKVRSRWPFGTGWVCESDESRGIGSACRRPPRSNRPGHGRGNGAGLGHNRTRRPSAAPTSAQWGEPSLEHGRAPVCREIKAACSDRGRKSQQHHPPNRCAKDATLARVLAKRSRRDS